MSSTAGRHRKRGARSPVWTWRPLRFTICVLLVVATMIGFPTQLASAGPGDAISVTAAADRTAVDAPGQKVTYTLTIANTGTGPLTGVTAALTVAGNAPVNCPPATTDLPAGASTTCTITFTVTQAVLDAGGTLTGSAHVTGTTTSAPNASDDDATPPVTVTQSPALTLATTPAPQSIDTAGDTVAYTFAVKNTGNVTVHALAVNATLSAPASDNGLTAVTCEDTTLAPGASTTCRATYTSTTADIAHGSIRLSATATATTTAGDTTQSDADTSTVTTPGAPVLAVTDTTDPDSILAAGDTVTYSARVSNTGTATATDLEAAITMTPPASQAALGTVTCGQTSLPAGQSTTCTATYSATAADIANGSIRSSTTATGTGPAGAVSSPSASATVDVDQSGRLTINAAATPTTVNAPGADIHYSFDVSNTGNQAVTNLDVAATITSPSGRTAPTVVCPVTSIAAGDSTTCTATLTTTQADIDNGTIALRATASGTNSTSATDSVSVSATQTPALTLAKTASPTTVTDAGQDVTYTFTVHNTGNVTITGLDIDDTVTSPPGEIAPTITCALTTLAPDATTTCTATHTTTQADIDTGSLADGATASGDAPDGSPVTSGADSATVAVTRTAALQVVKSASPTTVTALGQSIDYSIVVTNTGNQTLTTLAVRDVFTVPAGPGSALSCTPSLAADLAPGHSVTCTSRYVATQADVDNGAIVNTATATARDQLGATVTSDPSVATVAIGRVPALTLTKSASPAVVNTAAQTITYSFDVVNSGNVTLTGLAVTDAFTSPAAATAPTVTCPVTTLAPTDETTCLATYRTTQADLDNGTLVDTATATATAPDTATVSSNDSTATVSVDRTPALTLAKSASPATVTVAGQAVTYSFAVQNTGNVTVTDLAISDAFVAPSGGIAPTVTCPTAPLPPGATATCTATYAVTQADIDNGTIVNAASASATVPGGGVVHSAESNATVQVTRTPALTLVKTADPTTVSAPGQTITYSFAAKNTGNVTLSGLAVSDASTSPAGAEPVVTCPATTIAPGATVTCTATYSTTLADIDNGVLSDTATATATGPSGATATAVSTASVSVAAAPALTVTKTASPATVTAAGQTVTYTIIATNTGNQTLTGVTVADVFTAPAGPGTLSCAPSGATTLAPGAAITCSVTYTATQADIDNGSIVNTATAAGTDPRANAVTGSSTATVAVTRTPALTITKTATPTTVSAVGQAVSYVFLVKNTGNVTVTGIAVTDRFTSPAGAGALAVACGITRLSPGGSTTCTASYTTTQADIDNGTLQNTATASGTAPGGATVTSPPATATVDVAQTPTLTLVKSASVTSVSGAGQDITYSFAIHNTGNVTLTGLGVADTFTSPPDAVSPTVTCPVTTLAPGAATTCTATYTTTQDDVDNGVLINTATASATAPTGDAVTSNASATVLAAQVSGLTLTKSASPTRLTAAGQTITYSFLVTNTGNVTVSNLIVTDTFTLPADDVAPTVSCPRTRLAPNTSVTCTATYTALQSDIDGGSLTNTAVASGTAPGNVPVGSVGSTTTVAVTQSPQLTLTKTGAPTTLTAPFQTVTYSFLVRNSGNVTITGLNVTDVFVSPDDDIVPVVTCPTTTLAPAGTTTCTATYTTTQADIDNGALVDTGTAFGTAPGNTAVTSNASTATLAVTQTPKLTLDKSASTTVVAGAGQRVVYSFLVTNAGNVTLTGLAVTDTFSEPAGLKPTVACPTTTLAPGAFTTCTASYVTTQGDIDNGRLVNSAVSTATTPSGAKITSNTDTQNVIVTATQSPKLSLVKSASLRSINAPGQTIRYSFVVKNTGNVTVTALAINDVFTNPTGSTPPTITCATTSLTPSQSTTCTGVYTTTQADVDSGALTNAATARATSPAGTVTSNVATASVSAIASPSIDLAKTASPGSTSSVGTLITYSFTATNTGNVTVSALTVADTFTSPAGAGPAVTCPVTTLAPGASTTCTATHTTTQAELDNGSLRNSAVATVKAPDGSSLSSDPATATVGMNRAPALRLVKTASPTTLTGAGQSIAYSFAVTNTGNVTLTGVGVSDTFTNPATATAPTVTCPTTTLAPGAATTCTATYSATQADIDNGTLVNSALASATAPGGSSVSSGPAAATVNVNQNPVLTLVKSASPSTVNAVGQTISYTFAVTNTGNVTLTKLGITDAFTSPASSVAPTVSCPSTTLAPNASTTCTATYRATQVDIDNGTIANTAVAAARAPDQSTVTSNSSAAAVATRTGAITLAKTATPTSLSGAADTVVYTFVVTNTGNITVTGLRVADRFTAPVGDVAPPVICPITEIAPGAVVTCRSAYTATQADADAGALTDSATASATGANGLTLTSNTSDARVTIPAGPELTLQKTASVASVSSAGQTVRYTFLVVNTGNVTISGLGVKDTLSSGAGGGIDVTCPVDTLLPAGKTRCTASYTVTQDDLDAGRLSDAATATGTAPDGTGIASPEQDLDIDVVQSPALTVTKTAEPTTVGNKLGEGILYRFVVENTGNVTINEVRVDDVFTSHSKQDPLPVDCEQTSLAPGQSTTCLAKYATTDEDVKNSYITDTATADGIGPQKQPVTSDPSTALVLVQPGGEGGLGLRKIAEPTEVSGAGDTVTYVFDVTNTAGDVVTGIAIDDDFLIPGTAKPPEITCDRTDLEPGGSTRCIGRYEVTQDDADAGTLLNLAFAAGNLGGRQPIRSNPASAQVTIPPKPAVSLVKSADPAVVSGAGDTVTYNFDVTNTGNVTVRRIGVTDAFDAPDGDTAPAVTCKDVALPPGETTTCTATYRVTQDDVDAGALVDTAVAYAAGPNGSTATSDPSTATVKVEQTPALSVAKTAAPTNVTAAAQTIVYSFVVTNSGNITVADVSVDDAFTSPASSVAPDVVCPVTTLDPGQSTTCRAAYTTTQGDIDNGVLTDTATANGRGVNGAAATSPPDTATVTVGQLPKLVLTKTAARTVVNGTGQSVRYSFRIENTGNVSVTSITVADTFTAPPTATAPTVSCPVTTLAPGDTTTCTASYTTTQADIDFGSLIDTATASGTTPSGATTTSGPSTAAVTVTQTPGLALTKSASPTVVTAPGQTVTYSFVVQNIGNLTASSVAVSDVFTSPTGIPPPTVTCPVSTLAPGVSTTCTATHVTTQADIDNGTLADTATASARNPDGTASTSNTSTATVAVTQTASLNLTETGSPLTYDGPGQTISYTFTVENRGNVSATALTVSQSVSGTAATVTCAATSLAPGASTTCTATYLTTQADVDRGSIVSTATARATGPHSSQLVSNSTSVTSTARRSPQLTLTKAGLPATVDGVGQTIAYTFTVTNSGNVTVNALKVIDAFTAPPTAIDPTVTCPVSTLAPAAATTCTASYKTTQADLDNGQLVNAATASGVYSGTRPVTSNTATATVTVTQSPALTLVKTASPTTINRAGVAIDYSFAVTNTGNVTVSGINVADTFTSPTTAVAPAVACADTVLAPGASTTCAGAYTSTQADVDNGTLTNTAAATGLSPLFAVVTSNTSTAAVAVTQTPTLTITKTASLTVVNAPGQLIRYVFVVRNTGNVTITGMHVNDPFTSPATSIPPTVTCPTTTLAPGASVTCTASYVTTQADIDNGQLTNSATAVGTAPDRSTVTSAPATKTVLATRTPALSMTKTASPSAVTATGQPVTYSFLVKNTGNVTITAVHIDDAFTSPASSVPPSITCPATTLAPAGTTTCTGTYPVTLPDMDNGVIKNTATAAGTDPAGATIRSAASSATVGVVQAPALSLTKTPTPGTVTAAGQGIVYTFLVTNSGNVTVTTITVTDAFTSPAGTGPTVTCPPTSLAPGESITCTANYTTSQADIDNNTLINTAIASGNGPTGATLSSPPATATVNVTQSPALSLVKSATPTTVTAAAQTVSYSFAVTNSGNVTMTGLAITDAFTSPASAVVPTITCPVTTLAPAASTTCTATYKTTQTDIDNGALVNTATASAKSPLNVTTASNPSTVTVAVTQTPALLLTKSALPATVTAAGQPVNYSFVVKNTGNVTITALAIADAFTSPSTSVPPATITCPATKLAPAASTTCAATYTTTQTDIDNGTLVNAATANAKAPNGDAVASNSSSATVAVTRTPSLSITKAASPTTVTAAGQTISYTFGVKNTGNVTVTGVAVTDVFTSPATAVAPAVTCLATTLAPNASTTCTAATYTTTQTDIDNGTLQNSATAAGTAAGGAGVTSAPATATVAVTRSPSLTVVKSASPTTVNAPGQSVTYSFLVRNTGNVTITGVNIADTFTSPVSSIPPTITCPATTLAPTATTTCTGTYITTQTDIDNGTLVDTATAKGTAPGPAAVTSPASTATVTSTQSPSLVLTKSASPTTVTAAGQNVTYTFGVTNTGNVRVNSLVITDTFTSPATSLPPTITCLATTLAPAASTTCTGTYKAVQADIDNGTLNNSATAGGKTTVGTTVTSNIATATVAATRSPAITLAKTASPTTVTTVGQTITYSFLVTNTGNVTVTALTVADTFTSPATSVAPSVTCPATTLAPTASTTCTATYKTVVADMDNGTLVDSATATATAPDATKVTATSTATVAVTRNPALTLTKTPSPTTVTAAGVTITYTLKVTNSGNVTVNGISVTDVFTSPSTSVAPTVTCPVSTLAPAAFTNCTATYITTQADIDNGTLANTGTVTGTGVGGKVVTATKAATVAVTRSPTLTVTKSASPTTVTAAGQSVTYSFLVKNTGNVTITGVNIADTFTSPATSVPPSISCPATTLAPAATTTCTGMYTTTQTDIDNGTLVNSATAKGTAPGSTAVTSAASTATVTASPAPALTLTKSAVPATISAAGQSVAYSFLVTNTGNVTVSSLAITDTFTSPSTSVPPTITCPATTLAPAATTTCTGTYASSQTDIDNGTLVNSATASGKTPKNATVTSNASTATVNVTQSPVITLVKSANPLTVTAAGQPVAYSFLVRNTGNVTVTGVRITDAFTSPATSVPPTITCPATTLAPAASTTCAGTYTTTQADLDNGTLVDTATASATAPGNVAVTSNPSTATVNAATNAALAVTKSSTPGTVTAAGQSVAYSFLVKNAGNVTIRNIAVTDTFTSPATATAPTVSCPVTTLTPAATTTCTATYTTTQTDIDNGTLQNSAVATGTAPGGGGVTSPPSTLTVAVSRNPALTLTKTANPATVTAPGQTITYSFVVRNTGNVTVSGVSVVDTFTSPATATAPTVTCPATTLAPAATTICTGSYLTTQIDIDNGSLRNSASASGTAPGNTPVTSNVSAATVSVTQAGALTLLKSATPTTVTGAGQSVAYSFLVTNSGNVTISGLTVSDAFTSPASATAPTVNCPATTLAPAASTTCTATYTTTQTDADNGILVDAATASGRSPLNVTVTSNQSTATVTISQTPALTLVKTAVPTTVAAPGQTVTYTFQVTNSGNVTITGVSITDRFTSPLTATAPTVACPATTLAPGAATTCTGSYTTTQVDIDNGVLSDTATAVGTAPGNTAVTSNQSTAAVTATRSPALTLTKSASPSTITAAGQTVSYSFTARNAGNVTITGIAVADTFTSPASATAPTVTCVATTLAPAAATTCAATYAATQADIDNGALLNTAVASGTAPDGSTVASNPATAAVAITQNPGLALVKSADPTTVTAAGQSIGYSFAVTNTGNVTVTGLSIADAFSGPAPRPSPPAITCPATTLAPGAATTCTGTYATTVADIDSGTLVNAATASATAPGGPVTSNRSTATVTATRSPALNLTKTADPTTVTAAGQTVTYSFLVRNFGNVTVTGVAVSDSFTSPSTSIAPTVTCPATTLAPATTTTCTGTYTTTQTDIDNGTLRNSATASGAGPDGTAVSSAPATATVAVTRSPSLLLAKTADPTTVTATGKDITYSFTTTNTGNVTVTGLSISDSFTSPAGSTPPVITCPATTLAPAGVTTCTATYQTTLADIDNGALVNVASASAAAPGGSTVTSNLSTATVTATRTPSLLLTKAASTSTVIAAGQNIEYLFTLRNTGNVTITGIAIADTFTSPAGIPSPTVTCVATRLEPADTTTCTAAHTTTQADIDNGTLANIATAAGTAAGGATVQSNPASAVVGVDQSPGLLLSKSPTPNVVDAAGESITYSFAVVNNGNVTIDDLRISDTFTSPSSSAAPAVTCDAITLAPDASTSCTATYRTTQTDIDNGTLENTAVASGTDTAGAAVESRPASATVLVTQSPELSLTKSADPTTITAAGQTITYSFVVTNDGNVTIDGLAVQDEFTSPDSAVAPTVSCEMTTLAPTDTTTCTATYPTTQTDIDNGTLIDAATATGTDPGGAEITSNSSTATVEVTQAPALTLAKSADPATVTAAGEDVAYSFLVSNDGNVTITGLTISDAFTSPASSIPPVATCPVTTLAPTDTTTCTATYTTTQTDIDNGALVNAATASGADPFSASVTSAPSTATVDVTQAPALTLTKTADPTTVTAAGQTIDYSFLVTNDGNVTIANLAIEDSFTSPATATPPAVTCPAATLAPAASTTCTAAYVVTQQDIDNNTLQNTATAVGADPAGAVVRSNTSGVIVAVTQAPALTLVKSASPTTVSGAGQSVQYSFAVTNSGNVTVTDLAVNDAFTSPAASVIPAITCPVTTLAPADTTTCTGTYATTQTDIDNDIIVNEATAAAVAPAAPVLGRGAIALAAAPALAPDVVSNTSTAIVDVAQTATLTLTKTADPTTITAAGQNVDYSFAVVNAGNVTITGLAINDAFTSPATSVPPAIACPINTLAPAASTTCTGTYVATQTDIDNGAVVNSATASGTDPLDAAITSNTSSASVAVTQQPSLTVTKTADPTLVTASGQDIDYTFAVTNTGNVTLTELAINDTFSSPATSAPPTITCPDTTLAPTASTTCTGTYATSQDDIDNGVIVNTATAAASDPFGAQVVSDPSTATVDVTQSPGLTLVKSADPATVDAAGEAVTYSFAVTNGGNVTLHDLGISDTVAAPATNTPITCPVTTLAPSDSTTCTATYIVTQDDMDAGSLVDTATATGLDPGDVTVTSNPSAASVGVIQTPVLSLTKTPSPTLVSAVGETVDYQFVVVNNGNVTVADLGVDDTFTSPVSSGSPVVTCPVTRLTPGDSTTCTASHTVTQDDLDNGVLTNSATAIGTDPVGVVTSSPASADVEVTQTAALTLTKTASPATVTAAGQVVTYSFRLDNPGNVTLHDPTIVDTFSTPAGAQISPVDCPGTAVAPGASMVCTATYVVTQADVDAGVVLANSAVATMTAPNGDPITSNASAASVPTRAIGALSLVKSADPSTISAAGDQIRYTFTVTNTGALTLHDIAIQDTLTAPAQAGALSAISCPATSLAPAARMVCTATYVVSVADVRHGGVTNAAAASGTAPDGSGIRSTTSRVTAPFVGLHLTKRGAVTDSGGVIWTFTVINTSAIAVGSIHVSDPTGGPVTCRVTELAPGASTTCATGTVAATAAQLAAGVVRNTASATAASACPATFAGPAPSCPVVTSNTATASVRLPLAGGLHLVKRATVRDRDGSRTVNVGDVISWTVTVTNTTDAAAHGVHVEDPLYGPVICPSTTVAAGASMVCTVGPHVITARDAARGQVHNVAIVSGGGSADVSAEANVPFGGPLPGPVAYTGIAYLEPEIFGGIALIVVGLFLLVGVRRRRRS